MQRKVQGKVQGKGQGQSNIQWKVQREVEGHERFRGVDDRGEQCRTG